MLLNYCRIFLQLSDTLLQNITNFDLYLKYIYIYMYTYVCIYFTVHLLFFYFSDYIAQMLYVLTDKITEKSFIKSYKTYNRSAGHAILRLVCNPQFTDVETASHRSLSSAKQIRPLPVTYLTVTLMLTSSLRLAIPSSLSIYRSSLETTIFFAFVSSLACTVHPMFLDFIS